MLDWRFNMQKISGKPLSILTAITEVNGQKNYLFLKKWKVAGSDY
jgi:hypothetical protein